MKKTKHSFKYYWLRIKLGILSFSLDCYSVILKCYYDIQLVVNIVAFVLLTILGMPYLILKAWFENYILYKPSEECIDGIWNGYNKICNIFGVSFTKEEFLNCMQKYHKHD